MFKCRWIEVDINNTYYDYILLEKKSKIGLSPLSHCSLNYLSPQSHLAAFPLNLACAFGTTYSPIPYAKAQSTQREDKEEYKTSIIRKW